MTKQEFSEKYGFNSSVGAFGISTKDCRKELLIDLDNVIKALGLPAVKFLKMRYFIEEKTTGLWIPKKGNILTNNPLLAYKSTDKNKMTVYMALEKLKGFEVTEHEFV